jgi:hypothetical protein
MIVRVRVILLIIY